MKRLLIIGSEGTGKEQIATILCSKPNDVKFNGRHFQPSLLYAFSEMPDIKEPHTLLIDDVPSTFLADVLRFFYSDEFVVNKKYRNPFTIAPQQVIVTSQIDLHNWNSVIGPGTLSSIWQVLELHFPLN